MKLTNRHTLLVGLLLIIFGGISVLLNHPGFALKLTILSFFILLLGTLQYILELKNEK